MKTYSFFVITILFLFITLTTQTKTNPKSTDLPTFEQFKQRFKKQYATPEQQQYRKSVFNQNRKEVLLNSEALDGGVNVYTDKTLDEKKSQLFGLKVPENFTQIVAQSQHKVKAKLKGASVTYPTSLDWREKKAVTKVRNQKGCGSCWAFEVIGAAESLLLIQGKGNPNTLDLSEQALLQCTEGSSCNGGSPANAAQRVIKSGLINESAYPYRPDKLYGNAICSAKKDFLSPATSSANYYSISDQEMIQLLQVSPIGVTIDADSLSQRYDPTKNPVHKCSVGDNQINHGVLLVGYTPTYWIIKNSWGTKWGVDGFAYISRNRVNNENCVIHTWITVLESECNVANCKECSVQNSCGICKEGFYIVPVGNLQSCKQCIDPNCMTCYTRAQNAALEGRCKICKKGFSLEASSQKCLSAKQISVSNCLVHSSDFNTCVTCDDGYVLSNDAKDCMKCEVQNCEQCLTGYKDRCKACKAGYVGDKCDMICSDKCEGGCSAPGVCKKCKEGYTGKNCEVMVCIDNCLSCSKPNTCDECQPGYQLPDCKPVDKPKLKCSPLIQNCAKGCTKDANVCDECDKDFYGPQCNIQYVCDNENCKSIVTTPKPLLKSEQPFQPANPSDNGWLSDNVQDSIDSTTAADAGRKRQASLTIGMIIVSMLFVFTLGFALFLVYRLRTIKRINIIQPVESEGSSKSIPYVGKNIV